MCELPILMNAAMVRADGGADKTFSRDLFGEAPAGQPVGAGRGPKGGKHYTRPRGYAGTPGAGPADMKCRNCAHYSVVCGGAKSFPKCLLTRSNWTRGRGSDILAGSPACQFFEETARGDD